MAERWQPKAHDNNHSAQQYAYLAQLDLQPTLGTELRHQTILIAMTQGRPAAIVHELAICTFWNYQFIHQQ